MGGCVHCRAVSATTSHVQTIRISSPDSGHLKTKGMMKSDRRQPAAVQYRQHLQETSIMIERLLGMGSKIVMIDLIRGVTLRKNSYYS